MCILNKSYVESETKFAHKLPIFSFLLKKKLKILVQRTSESNRVTYFSAGVLFTTTDSALLGVLKTLSVQKGSVVIQRSWNTRLRMLRHSLNHR
jgi:hypothetical protein